ncbi:hypothetical protein M8J76_005632 [Diaphorina citri]|nr:hypothetical protein M8J76_005632 [Diaphorina citri]
MFNQSKETRDENAKSTKKEPEVGMAQWEAQKFFRQLISGVEYLHSKGIAHRDLKPENVLLDLQDTLKISDFGLATVFRMNGKERPLDKKCGTLPYVAPEVLVRSYLAEPADIWSCGIILVAMLAGELPWDKPTADCIEYLEWKDNRHMQRSPWDRLDVNCLSLIRRILAPLPSTRLNIEKIKSHRWYSKHMPNDIVDGPPSSDFNSTAKRMRSDLETEANRACPTFDDRACVSQPEPFALRGPMSVCEVEPHLFSFSQPTHLDDLLVSSQFVSTQSTQSNQSTVQKLVRRMTRFFVKYTAEEAVEKLCMMLDKLGYSWRSYSPAIVTISTVDSRKAQLVFKASVLTLDNQTLLDFRLSKGCGIEFKTRFLCIKRALAEDIINKPISWSVAIATNNV